MELSAFRTLAVPPLLDAATTQSFTAAVMDAMCDDTVGGLVLEGADDAFCLGMDLSVRSGSTDPGSEDIPSAAHAFADGLCLLAEGKKPIVAVVRGPARGGGVGIVAACDVVLAVPSATFGLPEGLLGLTPAAIAAVLLRRISDAQLRRLVLLAEAIGADEARAIGLVDDVSLDGAIDARVRRACNALMRVDPRTRAAVTATIEHARRLPLRAAVKWGVEETARIVATPGFTDRAARWRPGGKVCTT